MLKRPKNLYLFHTFNPMNQQNPWQTKSSKKIYENPWISLTEHQVINPSGGKGISLEYIKKVID
jgi:hypothetical protein